MIQIARSAARHLPRYEVARLAFGRHNASSPHEGFNVFFRRLAPRAAAAKYCTVVLDVLREFVPSPEMIWNDEYFMGYLYASASVAIIIVSKGAFTGTKLGEEILRVYGVLTPQSGPVTTALRQMIKTKSDAFTSGTRHGSLAAEVSLGIDHSDDEYVKVAKIAADNLVTMHRLTTGELTKSQEESALVFELHRRFFGLRLSGNFP